MKTSSSKALGIAAVGILLLAATYFVFERGSRQVSVSPAAVPAPNNEGQPDATNLHAATNRTEEAEQPPAEEPLALNVEEPTADDPEAKLRESLASLRLDLEETLFERINPSAILDVAQQIADLKVDLKVNPKPTIDGGVRFELEGVPEEINAALVVYHSKNPNIASISKLLIEYKGGPDYLHGAVRHAPTATIMAWSDTSGNPTDLVVSADTLPAFKESGQVGVDLRQSTVNVGMQYHFNASTPDDPGLRSLIMRNGMPADIEASGSSAVGPAPRIDKVERFNTTLLKLCQSVNNKPK